MADRNYRKFCFESEQGAEYTIYIRKQDYMGSSPLRGLGGSPVLRRDKSDNICGTSLEFMAEAALNNEYAEFYATDPQAYRVNLKDASGNTVWTGFLTPELYSEPDIAPPYDVKLTATDGLGELKRVKFPKRGVDSLRGHLSYLLGHTGLSLDILLASDLAPAGGTASGMLDAVNIILDHFEGETCYDVLQRLMVTMHAIITQYNGFWFIYRETGLFISHGAVTAYDGSANVVIPIQQFGSVNSYSWWPVGQMSTDIEPAKKSIVVTAPNYYKSNIFRDLYWSAIGGATYDSSIGAWNCASAGSGISQSLSFSSEVGQKLSLRIKARNIGNGTDAGNLSVTVVAVGTSYVGSTTYYLRNAVKSHRNDGSDYEWGTTSASCLIPLQAPANEDTDEDYIEVNVVIPLFKDGTRAYFRAHTLSVSITNTDGTYAQRIYGVELAKYEQTKGYEQTVNIGNGARGEASGVELAISRLATDNDYAGIEELQNSIPATTSGKVQTWSTRTFSSLDFMSLMARDYALSYALPRLRKSGTLNVPTTYTGIPMFMSDGINTFVVETASWRLANDEVDVEMISLPAASVTVASESVDAGETTNTTNHSQGVAASSSPAPTPGGGTVTSVNLNMPSEFIVTGGPITSAGTITVTLSPNYKILTTTEYNSLTSRSHTHGNKAVIDTITSTLVQNWSTAYQWGNHAQAGYLMPAPGTWSLTQLKYVVHCTSAEYNALAHISDDTLYIIDNS